MRQTVLRALLDQLLPIAREAGDAVMAVYCAGEAAVRQKADQSPVTEADLAAHRVLVQKLSQLMPPGFPVVSEEDEASFAHRRSVGCFWLIDPLDGTKEFLARNGEFTVNIALVAHSRSVLGVVYAPAIDTLYWGGPGLGAFRRTGDTTHPIQAGEGVDNKICRVVASKSHLNEQTQAFIERLGQVRLIQAGSSLKFCRLAEGSADLYPRLAPTAEWDTAAAQAVLEGAGGVVLDSSGTPLRYGKPDTFNPSFVAARNPALIPPYWVQPCEPASENLAG